MFFIDFVFVHCRSPLMVNIKDVVTFTCSSLADIWIVVSYSIVVSCLLFHRIFTCWI